MEKRAELLFLGTGGSMGVPVIGCNCAVCQSASPMNKRLRPSALIKWGGRNILVDAGPDYRTQALRYGINSLDGVIFTHAHHDHTAGVDDLRVYVMWTRSGIPCLLSRETLEDLQTRYAYIFETRSKKLTTKIELTVLDGERGSIPFCGMDVGYMTYVQAGMKVNGFRFGDLGYVTDIKDYPEHIFEDLTGVKTLVLSALRKDPSPMHFSIDDAVSFSKKVGAEQTWLVHIAHEVDHEAVEGTLPDGINLAYDGLSIPMRV